MARLKGSGTTTRGKHAGSDATEDSLLQRSPDNLTMLQGSPEHRIDAMEAEPNHTPEDDFQETQQSKSAQELLNNMVAGARKRHMVKKKNVFDSYASNASELENSITTLLDQHEEQSSSIHEAQLKRLQQLINHKAKLEAAMDAKLKSLKASYDAHSRDVEKVLQQRIKELQ